ncbi:hypothetical protein OE88DRAFT_1656409 [Heliocybe sulcata]|uniref:Uncharacterized protein n=1 Tax=Heliocybe sulcata TaxID=5364 RepID=A0A5C3N6Y4_9AGAM|nr:hypothetical protein OE88DRAFT_1656409 [Heliocybe sulcata]
MARPLQYSFVTARLLPSKHLAWLRSPPPIQAAERVSTQPFLALKFPVKDMSPRHPREDECLVIISDSRPPNGSPFYVPIWPNTEGPRPPIRIDPPLPFVGTLYFHTSGAIRMPAQPDIPSHPDDHVIGQEDRERLLQYLRKDDMAIGQWRRDQEKISRGTGGPEPVGSKWDTFSGRPHTETLSRPAWHDIEVNDIDEQGLELVNLTGPYEELEKLKR